jgi:acylphosphatase
LERVTRRFLVTGKVQGVYFRHSTRLEAERLAVGGLARNLPDGSVEVIAHGTLTAVESLRLWLQRGPKHARVAAVTELEPSPPDGAAGAPQAFCIE